MKSILILRSTLLFSSVLWAAFRVLGAEPTPKELQESAAARLVEQALNAELAGDLNRRRALLDEALQVDPEHAHARWKSGQVHFDGQWRNVGEISDLVNQDRRWQEYRNLRSSMNDTAEDHLELARWCRRKRLEGEERFHWVNVLLHHPDHEVARRRLRLREYLGGLYTFGQVAQHKQYVQEAKKNFDRYKPIFLRYRREAIRGDDPEQQAALEKLRAVADPDAIQALAYATTIKGDEMSELVDRLGREEAQRFVLDLNLAYIAALGNMPHQASTVRLVNHAVFSPFHKVRLQAAEALKPRPKTSYVPLLMSGLAAPVELQIDLDVLPDGSLTLIERLYQTGPEADFSQVDTSTYRTVIHGALRRWRERPFRLAEDIHRASRQAGSTAHKVELDNKRKRLRNARIEQVLKTTTGLAAGGGPEAWWKAWQEYNELFYPDFKPVYESRQFVRHYRTFGQRTSSCFVAGTPVWVQRGRVPIEQVTVGDLVLCQDPISGQLAYRPVLRTTTRPPTSTVRVTFAGETITATRGHRFWVNGRGWQMTKFLKAGSQLHCLDGPSEIDFVEDGDSVKAYNLVVGEFSTYFVGDSCVLVHDNSCPRPTLALVPGMSPSLVPILSSR